MTTNKLSTSEELQGGGQFGVRLSVGGERGVFDGGLPGLLQTADAGGGALWVAHDAAAGGVDEVGGAERFVGVGGLAGRLAGGEDGHDLAARRGRREHGREAGAGRGDDGVVSLAELVAQAVDVGMVDAGE